VQAIIEKKAEGEEIVTQPAAQEKRGRATNLMAALEASLAKAKGGASGSSSATARSTRASRAPRGHAAATHHRAPRRRSA